MESFTVLLVEDNPDDEFLANWVLNKCGIERIRVARDGKDAIELLFGSGGGTVDKPDLVILDLRLPKINGIEILRRIRENEMTAELPVIILTSSEDPGDKLTCKKLGITDFITKPLQADDFKRILQLCTMA
jgi:CheY-like chemotaxis protein